MGDASVEEVTGELLELLPLLNSLVASEVRRQLGDWISMPQFRVLGLLREQPQTLSALARRRRVSAQTMSELVQALVERGWVARQPDTEDRRQMLLTIAQQGRDAYERANLQLQGHVTPLVAQLAPEELAALHRALPALQRVLLAFDTSRSSQEREL